VAASALIHLGCPPPTSYIGSDTRRLPQQRFPAFGSYPTPFNGGFASAPPNSTWGVPFVEGKPVEGYDIPDDVIKKGFPASPPKEARIPISDIYFKPADSGNYAK
jgi:hypothetical protein